MPFEKKKKMENNSSDARNIEKHWRTERFTALVITRSGCTVYDITDYFAALVSAFC